MKRLMLIFVVSMALVFSFSAVNACEFYGCIYCDNDLSGTISEGDEFLAGVTVLFDGVNDYSAVTDAGGCFAVHTSSGTYTISLDPATIPADAVIIVPEMYPAVNGCVGSPDPVYIEQNFLIDSEICHQFTGEGCTPGYWKNHLSAWGPTGYSTSDIFNTVFGVELFAPNYTLGDAIKAIGGGANIIARHGTAALLSAAHPGVDYPYSTAEVIAMVQSGDPADLVLANELGCPLN